MIRRPPRSTQSRSSAASDVYKRQVQTPERVDVARVQEHAGPHPAVFAEDALLEPRLGGDGEIERFGHCRGRALDLPLAAGRGHADRQLDVGFGHDQACSSLSFLSTLRSMARTCGFWQKAMH